MADHRVNPTSEVQAPAHRTYRPTCAADLSPFGRRSGAGSGIGPLIRDGSLEWARALCLNSTAGGLHGVASGEVDPVPAAPEWVGPSRPTSHDSFRFGDRWGFAGVCVVLNWRGADLSSTKGGSIPVRALFWFPAFNRASILLAWNLRLTKRGRGHQSGEEKGTGAGKVLGVHGSTTGMAMTLFSSFDSTTLPLSVLVPWPIAAPRPSVLMKSV